MDLLANPLCVIKYIILAVVVLLPINGQNDFTSSLFPTFCIFTALYAPICLLNISLPGFLSFTNIFTGYNI